PQLRHPLVRPRTAGGHLLLSRHGGRRRGLPRPTAPGPPGVRDRAQVRAAPLTADRLRRRAPFTTSGHGPTLCPWRPAPCPCPTPRSSTTCTARCPRPTAGRCCWSSASP